MQLGTAPSFSLLMTKFNPVRWWQDCSRWKSKRAPSTQIQWRSHDHSALQPFSHLTGISWVACSKRSRVNANGIFPWRSTGPASIAKYVMWDDRPICLGTNVWVRTHPTVEQRRHFGDITFARACDASVCSPLHCAAPWPMSIGRKNVSSSVNMNVPAVLRWREVCSCDRE